MICDFFYIHYHYGNILSRISFKKDLLFYCFYCIYPFKKRREDCKKMEIEGYNFPDDLYYHKEHFWAKVVGNIVIMGTSDFAQKLAGQIVYVELPSPRRGLEQGKPCGSLESGKWVGRIYAPISGKVESSNQELEDTPELINESPYEKGWICKINPSNLQEELKNLMQGESLVEFIKSEVIRVKK
jgi:glycine cleavage system H protein